MCFQTWQHNAVVKDDGGAGGLTVFRCPEEVDVQQTRDGICHYLLCKMSRSRIVQECRIYSCKM